MGDTKDKLQLEQIKTLTSLHSIVMTLTSKYKDTVFVLKPTNAQPTQTSGSIILRREIHKSMV